jgi:hypothetical protein
MKCEMSKLQPKISCGSEADYNFFDKDNGYNINICGCCYNSYIKNMIRDRWPLTLLERTDLHLIVSQHNNIDVDEIRNK